MVSMKESKRKYLKTVTVFILCLLVRLIPFRAPNIEPIFAATMPTSRAHGAFLGFSFAVLSILFYDVLTGTMGMQTFFTAGAYGIIGLWAASYFKNKKGTKWDYAGFAIVGTLFFDAVTGLTVGPIFFHQSFMATLLGQIPFTMLHLLGNVVFAVVLSPVIYNFMIQEKEKKKIVVPINTFNPEII